MSVDFRLLQHIHSTALRRFTYADDISAFGREEYWMSPDEIAKQLASVGRLVGDCDDFAALCVTLARQADVPARFVLCLTEDGGSHLVAEAGGWVMDNRQACVMRRDDLPYQWLAISGFERGDPWRLIEVDSNRKSAG